MTDHIDTKDVAKIIRKRLKGEFQGVKFSVRISRYAGGSSININWTDGPKREGVESISRSYSGGGFDGTIDMAYYIDHWINDKGDVKPGKSQGTTDSRGYVEPWDYPSPGPEWRLVSFGSSYVFCHRAYSKSTFQGAAEKVSESLHIDKIETETNEYGNNVLDDFTMYRGEYLATHIYKELERV